MAHITLTMSDVGLQGRGGRGSVYVWAAGNGGEYFDSCAADGFVSSIYTIAVGSVNRDGTRTEYDELCAGKMTVAFSHSTVGVDNQLVRYRQRSTNTH